MTAGVKPHKCRRAYCPNYCTDIIGAPGSWGKNAKGECVPCFFAMQMTEQGQTLEQIEAFPEFMEQLRPFLDAYRLGLAGR